LFAVGAAGLVAWQASADRRTAAGPPPLDSLPDTAQVDTVATPVDSLGPDDALAADVEGRRFIRSRDYTLALSFFRRAIEIEPDNAEFRDHYGYTLLLMGRHADAEEALEEAVRLDATLDIAYTHLYQARIAQADTAGAIQALEGAMQNSIDPTVRREAQRRLQDLTAPRPVMPPPPPIIQPTRPRVDTLPPPDSIFIPRGGPP
ncbi:MAG TPA: tetratricopeptide repeat protein, partial [Longimicrobiaceae bacterium]|nr:tetratricopeptide repeat protein [Longimicrobiaceae bacterium]